MNHQLSLKKVILTDTIAFSALLLPVVLIGGFLLLIFTGDIPDISLDLLMVFGMIGFLSIALLAWRISIFTAVYHDDTETAAKITNVLSYRGSGWIGFDYTFLGQAYKSGTPVLMTKRVRRYRIGDEVVVLVDRSKPKRAFLRDLYLA